MPASSEVPTLFRFPISLTSHGDHFSGGGGELLQEATNCSPPFSLPLVCSVLCASGSKFLWIIPTLPHFNNFTRMKYPSGVRCAENQELASYMANKWKEMADQPKGISDNIEMALSKAHFNVSNSKTPIRTIKEFSQVKGVGKMILKLMQGFFGTAAGGSEPEDLKRKGACGHVVPCSFLFFCHLE
ncbi:Crossover junction endonuclease mus81 [Stylosanthes scabra]|uniref:Crossover junction endonuclease MUS81 n=1 Tax=Stylosanthes scabra TaxID=79078 RepID=A0ABU6Q9H6_9FABA|nr:Crossover junction endonuclease mus81 [Stylosanthes scabra]